MTTPTVSILMPAFNAQAYIEEAIRSVLAQTVTDWELLVLDDGSTDGTRDTVAALAAEDPRIRLLPNWENMGAARTRNRGLELCAGQYVALLDSDDVWYPTKLEAQLALLAETGADFAYSAYAIIDSRGHPTRQDYRVPPQVRFSSLLRENCIGCSTVILRREVADRYRFSTEFYHEDYVLWLQLTRDGLRGVGCTEVLAAWRLTENSRSYRKGQAAKNRWQIYRQYLKLPLWKSAALFAAYAVSGLRKYLPPARDR